MISVRTMLVEKVLYAMHCGLAKFVLQLPLGTLLNNVTTSCIHVLNFNVCNNSLSMYTICKMVHSSLAA